MVNVIIQTILTDGLWLLIAVGWVVLILIGLEADKPLSGGIPGHVNPADEHVQVTEGAFGRLGETGAWVVFGLAALSLPVVLWWIFSIQAG